MSVLRLVRDRQRAIRAEQPQATVGQSWFNALQDLYPEVAEELAESEDDPTSDDSRVQRFINRVQLIPERRLEVGWDQGRPFAARTNNGVDVSGGAYFTEQGMRSLVTPDRRPGIYALLVPLNRDVGVRCKFGRSKNLRNRVVSHLKALRSYGTGVRDLEFRYVDDPEEHERELFRRLAHTPGARQFEGYEVWDLPSWRIARQVLFDREDVQ